MCAELSSERLPPAAGTQQLQNALTAALRSILAGQALTAGQQAQLAAAASTAAATSGAAPGTGVLSVCLVFLCSCWRQVASSTAAGIRFAMHRAQIEFDAEATAVAGFTALRSAVLMLVCTALRCCRHLPSHAAGAGCPRAAADPHPGISFRAAGCWSDAGRAAPGCCGTAAGRQHCTGEPGARGLGCAPRYVQVQVQDTHAAMTRAACVLS